MRSDMRSSPLRTASLSRSRRRSKPVSMGRGALRATVALVGGGALLGLLWLLLAQLPPPLPRATLALPSHAPAAALVQEEAARALLVRLLGPAYAGSFSFQIITEADCAGSPCFQVHNGGGGSAHIARGAAIQIRGTSGVELASGLHWYLKQLCGAHVSWEKTGGSQLRSVPPPDALPRVPPGAPLTRRRPAGVALSYYQNVVTASYTSVWWNWSRWEAEIDWMALQGVNLAPVALATEAVWARVLAAPPLNVSAADLAGFFSGAAFLAWQRMGNLHGWGGPLPGGWAGEQAEMQRRVLRRMRSLGMRAVLPAFAGFIPAALAARLPPESVVQLGNWGTVDANPRWCCSHLLEPAHPLFQRLGSAIVAAQIREFGTDHVYSADTFNEMEPPSSAPAAIAAVAAAVFAAMKAADAEAVWLMQGWLFKDSPHGFWQPPQIQALLTAVPLGRMVVLDLIADVRPVWTHTRAFYGVPFIWCMLHNFGGNLGMYGNLEAVVAGPVAARRAPGAALVGVGMCPEGLEQNPVAYELMAEMAFRAEALDRPALHAWVRGYARRRYGGVAEQAERAWGLLLGGVYNCTDGRENHNRDVIAWFPDVPPALWERPHPELEGETRRWGAQGATWPSLWYDPAEVVVAWRALLAAAGVSKRRVRAPTGAGEESALPLEASGPLLYDLVDVGRQVMAAAGNALFAELTADFVRGDAPAVERRASAMLELLADLDQLLGSRPEFLLGPWLEAAKSWGRTQEESTLLEWNARTQLTMWFDALPDKPSPLHDYANKHWSGLVGDYYARRWRAFLGMMQEAVEESRAFPYQEWLRTWVNVTQAWQLERHVYPTTASGDTLALSLKMLQKWGNRATLDFRSLEERVAVHT